MLSSGQGQGRKTQKMCVATFLNVAGTKLGFWTFAKVFDEKRQVLEFFVYFQSKFLSKTTK